MVEAGAKEVSEETMLEAIAFGHARVQAARARSRRSWCQRAGKPRWTFDPTARQATELLAARSRAWPTAKLAAALATHEKHGRAEAVARVFDEVWAGARAWTTTKKGAVREAFEEVEKRRGAAAHRRARLRVDGRKVNEIRPISIEMAYLPRAHGSSLFTRGETQALVSATLGTKSDEQKIEALEGESYRHFMLHYNFPSFSVGEVRRFGSPSRRDIGHGALAERAVEAVLPPKEEFPYTIRVVSDILESNGSSSMASVCGASLALMDAGVPLKSHVAGIAMGLVKEGDRSASSPTSWAPRTTTATWTSRSPAPRRASPRSRWTSRSPACRSTSCATALQQAREARLIVLGKMREALEKPRAELSPYAPRFVTIKIRHGEDPRDHRPRRQGHPRHPGRRPAPRSTSRTTAGSRSSRPTTPRCRRRSA